MPLQGGDSPGTSPLRSGFASGLKKIEVPGFRSVSKSEYRFHWQQLIT